MEVIKTHFFYRKSTILGIISETNIVKVYECEGGKYIIKQQSGSITSYQPLSPEKFLELQSHSS